MEDPGEWHADLVPARDDFPAGVKRHLAEAAGTLCCAPFCRKPTIGLGSEDKTMSIGVAAHITAASKGGPRYEEDMDPKVRRSAANGIWMCQEHSRVIDVDDAAFPTELILEWKRLGELRSMFESKGEGERLHDLATFTRVVPTTSPSEIATTVGEWGHYLGLSETWGMACGEAVEALLAEIALNVADHGQQPSPAVELSTHERVVTLAYPGEQFGVAEWAASQQGGGATVLQMVMRDFDPPLLVNHTYRHGVNSWYVAFKQDPGDGCSFDISDTPTSEDIDRLSGCSRVRLRAGGGSLTMSLPKRLIATLQRAGVEQVLVVDVDARHVLAEELKSWARGVGVELRFLGIPSER